MPPELSPIVTFAPNSSIISIIAFRKIRSVEAGGGSSLLKFGLIRTLSPLDIARVKGPSASRALSTDCRIFVAVLTLETMGLPSLSHGFTLRGFGGTSEMFVACLGNG
jgi:hypothetical protein